MPSSLASSLSPVLFFYVILKAIIGEIKKKIHKNFEEISFISLLIFLEEHFPTGKQSLEQHVIWKPEDSVYLGNNVLNQLNMISMNSQTNESILSYFQKTFTPMGKREIVKRLLYPISDINVLSLRIFRLEEVMQFDSVLKKSIESCLKQICDLQRIHHKFFSYSLNANDILALEQSYVLIRTIIDFLKDTKIAASNEFINKLDKYIHFFRTQFDIEKAKRSCEDISFLNNEIAPKTFCSEKELQNKHDDSQRFLEKIKEFSNQQNIRLEENNIEGTRTIMTNIDTKLKNTKKELWPYKDINITIRKTSGSLSSSYLDEIYMKVLVYRENLKKYVKIELPPICNTLSDMFTDTWLEIEDFITDIDIIFTIAKVCKEKGFTKPIYQDNSVSSGILIEGLRHPLIEAQTTQVEYVKHNVNLNMINDSNGWLLYGMNASGKSSLMKAVGICTLLAQVGSYVPCDSCVIKPYRGIYTRILNHDNIHAGLSSFAVEMLELREILKKADQYSLVLGDELCSGTESVSATALVASGIIWLHNKNTSFIFATHYHGLNELEQIRSLTKLKIYHLKVHYDPVKDLLVYDRHLEEGPGNTYYGLEVAKAMNIPHEFLEQAYEIRKEILQEKTKISVYNKNIIVKECEVCKCSISHMLEVHHITQQKDANTDGILPNGLHKNNARNLIVVCAKCHDNYHSGKINIGPVKNTSDGLIREITAVETTAKKSKWKNEELSIIHSYLKKYPKMTHNRLIYELNTNEDIKISEASLRSIRKDM